VLASAIVWGFTGCSGSRFGSCDGVGVGTRRSLAPTLAPACKLISPPQGCGHRSVIGARSGPCSSHLRKSSLVVVAIAAAAFLLWHMIDVVALVFGGVVLAVALRALVQLAMRQLRLRAQWAFLAVAVVLFIVLVGLMALIGARVADQLGHADRAGSAVAGARAATAEPPRKNLPT
jgi:hypothetical protein